MSKDIFGISVRSSPYREGILANGFAVFGISASLIIEQYAGGVIRSQGFDAFLACPSRTCLHVSASNLEYPATIVSLACMWCCYTSDGPSLEYSKSVP